MSRASGLGPFIWFLCLFCFRACEVVQTRADRDRGDSKGKDNSGNGYVGLGEHFASSLWLDCGFSFLEGGADNLWAKYRNSERETHFVSFSLLHSPFLSLSRLLPQTLSFSFSLPHTRTISLSVLSLSLSRTHSLSPSRSLSASLPLSFSSSDWILN